MRGRMNCLKSNKVIYLLLAVKVILTLGIYTGAIDSVFSPFSVVTVFYSFALAYNPDYALIAIILLFSTILILSLAVITMLLGIISYRARKASAYLIAIAMVIDFIVSFFVSSIPLKLACIVASAISWVLCIPALKSK